MEERTKVLTIIASLDRWVSIEEIAQLSPYSIETVWETARVLNQQRQISSFRDYFGKRRFARVPELVGRGRIGRWVG